MPNFPDVSLHIELGQPLAWVLKTSLQNALQDTATREISDLLHVLGLPGQPNVRISALPDSSVWVQVHINDQLCRYPEELLLRAYSYISGQGLHRGIHLDKVGQWIREGKDDPAKYLAFAEFVCLVCLEAIKQQPEVLLGESQLQALVHIWQAHTPVPESFAAINFAELGQTLKEVLRLRISLADSQTVAHILSDGFAQAYEPEAIAESLIEALRPKTLEIWLSSTYLRDMTGVDTDTSYFNLMRDGLFYETGLEYPNFEFVLVDDLGPNGIMFRINHLTTLPQRGLPAQNILVGASPDELKGLEGEAQPYLNPANGNEASQINLELQSRVPREFTTWKAMGHLILCLSAELRTYGECFVDGQFARRQLDRLREVSPMLVQTVRTQWRDEQLTRLLRNLSAEQVSIRDLGQILNAVLDYDFIIADSLHLIVFDDRLSTDRPPDQAWFESARNLSGFVRTCLKRYLSHNYTRGKGTLMVYLLDRDLESQLYQRGIVERASDSELLSEDELERFLEAVREETRTSAYTYDSPAILTTAEIRPMVHKLIAMEFPKIPVLAYQELSPELNITPIARITPFFS